MIIKKEVAFKVIGWVVTHFRLFIRNLIRLFANCLFYSKTFHGRRFQTVLQISTKLPSEVPRRQQHCGYLLRLQTIPVSYQT